jgi:hypothetical protein
MLLSFQMVERLVDQGQAESHMAGHKLNQGQAIFMA